MDGGSTRRFWRTSGRQLSEWARCGRSPARLLAAVPIVSAAAPANDLKPYTATYNGIWHGMTVAVSTLKLEQTGDTWTFSSRSEGRGIGKFASSVFPPL